MYYTEACNLLKTKGTKKKLGGTLTIRPRNRPENEEEAIRADLVEKSADCVEVLYSVALDEDAKPRERIAAATAILDRAGLSPQAAKGAGTGEKALAGMSAAQLGRISELARLEMERRIAAARPVLDGGQTKPN